MASIKQGTPAERLRLAALMERGMCHPEFVWNSSTDLLYLPEPLGIVFGGPLAAAVLAELGATELAESWQAQPLAADHIAFFHQLLQLPPALLERVSQLHYSGAAIPEIVAILRGKVLAFQPVPLRKSV